MSFGKIFEQTFNGSMMGAGSDVFAVWAYAIAHLKPPGIVELNPRHLAALLGMTKGEVEKAIGVLTKPDPESRTKDHEGRRLLKQDGFNYLAPTFARYRNGTPEEQRAANAARQRRFREKNKKTPLKNGERLGTHVHGPGEHLQ